MSIDTAGRNWAGNYRYQAAEILRPRTVGEVQDLAARHPRLRALGTRHSFTDLPDSAVLLSLSDLEAEIEIDADSVRVPPAVTYAGLAIALNAAGRGLGNLASLPHICVAGAVATSTHGSGDRAGNLSTAVSALELVTADGELRTVQRGDPDFDGHVVGLGALGIVTSVTLDTEPAYEVSQRVYEGLTWATALDHLDSIMGCGDSVSIFHAAGAQTEQLWVKRRAGRGGIDPTQAFGVSEAEAPRNPVPGAEPANCTEQEGVLGPWSERLPHFRSGFTPSAGEEIQSELLVARQHARPAIEAMLGLGDEIAPLLQIGELRTIAADRLWLSTAAGRDTLGLHFTWRRRPPEVAGVVARLEAELAPFAPRPHWGKLMTVTAAELGPRYPRMADFLALRERLDPERKFVNAWLQRHIIGED